MSVLRPNSIEPNTKNKIPNFKTMKKKLAPKITKKLETLHELLDKFDEVRNDD
jgi:hypothetical protein